MSFGGFKFQINIKLIILIFTCPFSLFANSNSVISKTFSNWYEQQAIPGVFDSTKRENSTKVYSLLDNFLYNEQELTIDEIKNIPVVLKKTASKTILKELENTVPFNNCRAQHEVIFFEPPQKGIGISSSVAMKGFEKGLVQVMSTACLKNIRGSDISHRASQLILSESFRNQIMPGRNSWNSNTPESICERLEITYFLTFTKTFLYCMSHQVLNIDGASFVQTWNETNGLFAEGMTSPIFYNHFIASFQETEEGLKIAINIFVRGLGGAGVPKGILQKQLLNRQELMIKELQNNLSY